MALLDWSTTVLGYPAHRLSGAAVVALSHMGTPAALQVATRLGLGQGFLQLDYEQPHLEGLPAGELLWVDVAELFATRRVAETDGLVSGTVCYVPCAEGEDGPNPDRELVNWAEETGHAWIRIVDNEYSQWGGAGAAVIDALLCWFLATHPVSAVWHETSLQPDLAARLREGLFDHGWSRNGEQVVEGRGGVACRLWGGVHGRSVLGHSHLQDLTVVQSGLAVQLRDGLWTGAEAIEACPLDAETGRLAPRVGP